MAIQHFSLTRTERSFVLLADGREAFAHSEVEPAIYMGVGESRIAMQHGNFDIEDELRELCPLVHVEIGADGVSARFSSEGGRWVAMMRVELEDGRLVLRFSDETQHGAAGSNGAARASTEIASSHRGDAMACANWGVGEGALRVRIRLPAKPGEHVYGCGEQFSYFDLRGRKFPLWTSEQGVGRNKSTRITHEADLHDHAGGDYWWTFFPQPTFASSEGYWVHADTSAYSVFDFRRERAHELYFWELPRTLLIGQADSMPSLLRDLSAYFGRQTALPDWIYDGVILGIQGGTEVCEAKLRAAREAGVPVAGIWAQDWEGINITSFGQRLRWNWVWNAERYPGLDRVIVRWKSDGVRFLVYANCYVGRGWSLCDEAAARGFLVKNMSGEDYYVDFGEFYAGIVDLTNSEAFDWYAGELAKNILTFGASGWMADFGEYLPTDAALYDGMPALIAHNLWPALWARCNAEAIRLAHAEGDAFFFMRAGFTGSQRWCPMMWAGDQNVDWSNDDGLPSAVRAALGLAMCGHGLHHSDIGGYTTLYGMHRTKELFMRWTEQAAFSPLMRTHEGNRPKDNWQFDSDAETLAHFGRMARVHVALSEYLKASVAENTGQGMPVMRPLFLAYPEDERAWTCDNEYLFGPDLLVAPVMTEGARSRTVHFPGGVWLDFWNGESAWSYESAGEREVDAPIGAPPVFIRSGSPWMITFEASRAVARE